MREPPSSASDAVPSDVGAGLPPDTFFVELQKEPLLARARNPTADSEGEAITIHDVQVDDGDEGLLGGLDGRFAEWVRRHEADVVHPCHWVIFAVLGFVFALSLCGWALTFHEYTVR